MKNNQINQQKEFNKVFRELCKHFGHNWRLMRNKINEIHKNIDTQIVLDRINATQNARSGSF